METKGPQEPQPRRNLRADHESLQPQPGDARNNKGGWITFPFLAVAMLGLGVARGGATSNFVVYLVKKYNVPRVDAVQISSIALGCLSLAPVGGAIVADAFFGCYPVVAVSMVFSVLALVMFTLTASLHGLRPVPCQPGAGGDACEPASTGQMAALYAAVFMLCVSAGGARFNQATLGASQFDAAADRDVLFNWYFVFFYASSVVGSTAIVYVQDNVSWALGYAISGAASLAGVAALLAGTPYYRRPGAQGSPFTALARVAVAAARKWKVNLATTSEELRFYHGRRCSSASDKDGDVSDATSLAAPSDSFSFLNRAALLTDGDVTPADGSVVRPWRICTVREVEDFKAVVRILPLWSSSIVLSVAFGTQINFTVLQALAMDRALGGFTVPAGSMTVVILVSIVASLILLDRALLPLWRRLTGHTPTPLQRIGAGHVLAVLSLAACAVVERRRMATVRAHGAEGQPAWVSPLSVTWLVLPLALAGAGEALYFPGGVTLYYEEFPPPLRNTSTGMVAVVIALGFYLSAALVGVVRRATAWLPNNMNASRLENIYWLLAVMATVNFGYYLLCAKLYKYQNVGK
ncbi:protein NRT1/ PTR FAMILY 2.3 [Setaria italica]|uniref:Major facilitator superfamily (MFS) profile domain-containing protein n=1 Tax=Setaria italica TaxID=4555 RepID=K3Z4X2_SETIT|nr:protein NRT1/ PTR FAMILY 2.3 [Setaria italica]